MVLRTLGGLGIEGADFKRSKPLLLLCYLALEGPKARRHLADLFWQDAASPLGSLSVALSQLRRSAPGSLEADAAQLRACLPADVQQFLDALAAEDVDRALALYRGSFLAGVHLDWGAELEEWVYATREFLAGQLREGLLRQAERSAAQARFGDAAALAERAYRLSDAPPLEPDELARLHRLLGAAHPLARQVRQEAEDFGVVCTASAEAARVQLARTSSAPPSGLPPTKALLLGRERELSVIAELLAQSDCRLLSLTGPGGIGKTRLALQAAHEQQGAFADGAHFVSLEALAVAEQLPAAIARALGGSLSSRVEPTLELAGLIGEKQLLLVLDNFEQLMTGRALLVTLLERCPRLKLLVTSRERLQLTEEWVLPVEGLSLPPAAARQPPEVQRYGAVQLFVHRARHADARFSLTAANVEDVLAICRAVDGSPLGLELAACWVRTSSCAQLAGELAHSAAVLETSLHDLPERHRSLSATFEQSWRLLSSKERGALARLSVFGGGFSRDAAREVASVPAMLLAAFTDKSLLRRAENDRFDWHPLLHQYVRAKLEEAASETRDLRARHARYYLGLVQRQETRIRSREQADAFAAIEGELDNVRSAWHWAVTVGEVSSLAGCAFALAHFFDKRARVREGVAAFALALEGAPAHEALGRLLVGQAWLHLRLGNYETGRALAERGAVLLEAARDEEGVTWALQSLATADYKLGAYEQARSRFQALLERAEARGEREQVAYAHGRLGVVDQARGDDQAARRHYQAALAGSRAAADPPLVVSQLLNLGALELNTGHTERAEKLFREGLALAREAGDRQIVPVLLHNLANVACKGACFAEALALAREALELVRKSGEKALETGMLATLGWIALEAGRLEEAERYAAESLQLAWALQDIPATLTALLRFAELWAAQQRLDTALKLLKLIGRHPAGLTWVRRRAERTLALLQAQGAPEALSALTGLDLDEVVGEVLVDRRFSASGNPP